MNLRVDPHIGAVLTPAEAIEGLQTHGEIWSDTKKIDSERAFRLSGERGRTALAAILAQADRNAVAPRRCERQP